MRRRRPIGFYKKNGKTRPITSRSTRLRIPRPGPSEERQLAHEIRTEERLENRYEHDRQKRNDDSNAKFEEFAKAAHLEIAQAQAMGDYRKAQIIRQVLYQANENRVQQLRHQDEFLKLVYGPPSALNARVKALAEDVYKKEEYRRDHACWAEQEERGGHPYQAENERKRVAEYDEEIRDLRKEFDPLLKAARERRGDFSEKNSDAEVSFSEFPLVGIKYQGFEYVYNKEYGSYDRMADGELGLPEYLIPYKEVPEAVKRKIEHR